MPLLYRLAAVDLDDTLLGPDKLVSAANRAALARLRALDCRVVLASGRRHGNMAHFYPVLGLEDYVVSCQGARVQHSRTGEVLHAALVPAGLVREARLAAAEFGLTVVTWSSSGIFASMDSRWAADYAGQTGGEPMKVDRPASGEVEKLVWVGDPAHVALARASAASRFGAALAVTEAHPWCLELAHPEATKAAGVAAVARHAGIPAAEVLAFGDGYNDIPLLRWAGLGVAMPHGRDGARQAAHRIGSAGSPEDALARALNEVLEAAAAPDN